MDIKFDPAEHHYWIDGVEVPSVSRVLEPLKNFSGIPPAVLENAAQFGRAVHKTVELFERGTLDTANLDPALNRCLERYKLAQQAKRFAVITTEQIVGHAALRFAGTLDMIARIGQTLWLVDIKTGSSAPTVGPQTAGYRIGYLAVTGTKEPIKRACLYLAQDKWHWIPLNDKTDENIFLSCINIFHWRAKNGNFTRHFPAANRVTDTQPASG